LSDPISGRLASLPHLSKSELCQVWKELFDAPSSPRIHRCLMIRILSYRLQEQAYGGLSAASIRRLRHLAQKLEANPKASLSSAPSVKPGTRFIRQWQDQTHVVTAEEKSYEYGGKRYSSLSQIARLITGTNWSGPLFFGLKDKQSPVANRKEA
jgi:hypothetical protein